MPSHVVRYPDAGGVAGLVHRQQYAVEGQLGVGRDDRLDRAQDLRRCLQRERLALQRNQRVLAGLQCAAHDRSQPGRRVHDDDVASRSGFAQRLVQHVGVGDERLVPRVARLFGHGSDEEHAQPRNLRRQDDLPQPGSPDEVVEEPVLACPRRSPGAEANRALRVDVHQECGSPRRANAAARLTAVVVLPTPPFWLTTDST